MNFLEMVSRAWTESGRSGTGPAAVSSATDNGLRAVLAVKSAWADIQAEPRNWRWMRKTIASGALVADQTTYTQANLGVSDVAWWWPESYDYQPTVRISGVDGEWGLRWLSYDQFRSLYLVGTHTAGYPMAWSTAPNGDLLIGPKPDGTNTYLLRIDYMKTPQELSVNGDTPDMPSRHHMAIVWRALQQIAIQDGSQENLARAERNAEVAMDALYDDQGEPIVITSRPLA